MSTTYIVKAPNTQLSCREVGAQSGTWQLSLTACLKDGHTCSVPSDMLVFEVADK
jgi:hypothetical protein